jgi:hypothetical protein
MFELDITKVYTAISVEMSIALPSPRLLYTASHDVRMSTLALVSWGIRLSGLVPGS